MENKVRQAHGANKGATCAKCGKKQEKPEELQKAIQSNKVLRCSEIDEKEACGGPIKPNITFFGESLPVEFFNSWDTIQSEEPEGGCDLLIVIGTSLAVKPFSLTLDKVSKSCPQVLINLENTESKGGPDFEDLENYPNRLFIQGTCDSVIQKIVKDLDWTKEFTALNPE